MKLKLSAISFAITLSYASFPALAAPLAEISQDNQAHVASIEQVGATGDTHAKITQGTGISNEARIEQVGTSGATEAIVLQRGTDNYAFARQTNGYDSTISIDQLGDNNNANATQDGNSHTASITQDSTGSAAGNTAITRQQGSNNEIIVSQTGNNFADVNQSGTNHFGRITQLGASDAYLVQSGNGHRADIYQSGGSAGRNYASVSQSAATSSIANVSQTGHSNNANIIQR